MSGERFFTADLHLGHGKVALLRGFDSVEAHDAAILDMVTQVPKGSTLWVLGDVAVGKLTEHQVADLRVATRHLASVHLVSGNHDPTHGMHRTASSAQSRYLEAFDSIHDMAQVRHQGRRFLLSHFPYLGSGDRGGTERYPQYRLPNLGKPLIHGHTHQDSPTTPSRPNQVCVSFEAWGRPASLTEIHRLMQGPWPEPWWGA